MENLLCFRCLENLPVSHIERLHTSKFIVNSLLLVLNISNKNWFHLIRSFLAKVIWFLGCPSSAPGPARPGSRPDLPAADQTNPTRERTAILAVVRHRAGNFRRAARPSGLQSGGARLTAELSDGLLPTTIFSTPINTPSSSLSQPCFWASLSSIVDLQSLPSLLHSLHVSCIFLREMREEI
jgi:hypothetical protein